MMGQQLRTQSLFYYFRLEDQIPEDHLLRLIDRHVDLSFVRERLRSFYSSTGRPSIVALVIGGLPLRDHERAAVTR
jgi:transposase